MKYDHFDEVTILKMGETIVVPFLSSSTTLVV